jgi:hypothetical protein
VQEIVAADGAALVRVVNTHAGNSGAAGVRSSSAGPPAVAHVGTQADTSGANHHCGATQLTPRCLTVSVMLFAAVCLLTLSAQSQDDDVGPLPPPRFWTTESRQHCTLPAPPGLSHRMSTAHGPGTGPPTVRIHAIDRANGTVQRAAWWLTMPPSHHNHHCVVVARDDAQPCDNPWLCAQLGMCRVRRYDDDDDDDAQHPASRRWAIPVSPLMSPTQPSPSTERLPVDCCWLTGVPLFPSHSESVLLSLEPPARDLRDPRSAWLLTTATGAVESSDYGQRQRLITASRAVMQRQWYFSSISRLAHDHRPFGGNVSADFVLRHLVRIRALITISPCGLLFWVAPPPPAPRKPRCPKVCVYDSAQATRAMWCTPRCYAECVERWAPGTYPSHAPKCDAAIRCAGRTAATIVVGTTGADGSTSMEQFAISQLSDGRDRHERFAALEGGHSLAWR